MGDNEHRPPGHEGIHALFNELFRPGVDGGGGLVQNQHRGIGHRRPGDGQQLPLPLAQAAAVAGDGGVIPLGQVADEAVGVGQLGCGHDLLVGGVGPPIADVLGDGAGKQVRVLQHHAQGPAQGVFLNVAHVDSVIGDGPGVDVIEAVDEVRNGGLSRAGGAHKGDLLPGLGVQAHVVQHGLFLGVAEVHMVKPHVAPQLRHGAVGSFPGPAAGAVGHLAEGPVLLLRPDQYGLALVHLRLLLHHGEDALRAGHGGQDGVHLLAHLGDGLGHLLHIQQVRRQGSDVSHAADSQQTAHAAGHGVVDAGEVAHSGHHGAGVGLGGGGRLAVALVEGVKLVNGLLLVVKDLDDLLPLDHLLHIAVHRAQCCLLLLKAHPAAPADGLHREEHQHQKGNGDKRQHPVQIQHHAHGAQEGQGAGDEVCKAGVDHLRNGVNVVGKPAHEVAGLMGVKVPQGQGLHLVEQIPPDGRHSVLGDVYHDPRIGVGARARQQERPAQHAQHPDQSREIPRQDIVVDNGLEQVAGQNGCPAAHHQAHRYHCQRPLVAAHVFQQLFHGALHVLGLLVSMALPAAGPVGPGSAFCFSHQWHLLPAGIHTLPCKFRWFSAALHGCPHRIFCRRPAPR